MKCALPGMYGRKAPIVSDALCRSYTPITKEFLMDDLYDDFHKAIEEYKKMLENVLENMDLDSDINKIKKHNYEKELEALKQYLLQKDKEEHDK